MMRAVPRLPGRRDAPALAHDRARRSRCFVASLVGDAASCRSSSSRPPTGPSCWSICSCRRTPRSMPREASSTQLRSDARRAIPTSSAGAPMSGAARSASTCRSTSSSPNDFFAPGGHRHQGRRGARPAAAQARRRAGRTNSRASSRASAPLELGPPVGWPVQYRVSGPDPAEVRDDRAAARAGRSRPNPRRSADQLRLDGARAQAAGPSRPGPGAPARPQLAGVAGVLNAVVTGIAGHAGARRHLSDRRRRARRPTSSASRSTTLRNAAGPAAERPHRAAQPVRDLRVRAGVSADLAPRPRADPHRAGRRGAAASLPATVVVERSRRRSPSCTRDAAARLPRSRSAARSRRAPSRRPRSSPWCR